MKPIIQKIGVLTAMLLAFITASAYDFKVDGVYYNIIDESTKEVSVTCGWTPDNSYSGDIIIPTSVTKDNVKYSVTSIGSSTFYGCSSLTSITIPNSVTSIGNYAFEKCSELTSITLPNSVTSIGNYTFYDCSRLTSITLPNSVTSIGSQTFYGCSSLTSITIPNRVTSIDAYAFSGCSRLASITFGTGLTYISMYAFERGSIKKAFWLANTPPAGANHVSASINYVANDQYKLSNQTVYPFLNSRFEVDNVVYVPVSPSDRTCDIVDCNYNSTSSDLKIDSIVTNKGVHLKVLNVNPYAFYKNQSVNSLKISNAGNIGESAFYDCDALISAKLDNKGLIGTESFYSCDNLSSVTISSTGSIMPSAFRYCTLMGTAIINNKGYIDDYAFADCNMSEKLEIGKDVTAIGNYAFQNNKKLKQLILSDNISGLGQYAFSGCNELEKISIGKRIPILPKYVFSGCSALSEISIPSNVALIEDYAFSGCTSLSDVTIMQSDEGTMAYNILELGSNDRKPIFADCPLDEVYIGRKLNYSTTSSKGYSPFYRNSSLRAVTITDAETEIYDNEFYGCSNLQSFSCGDGVTKIGKWAFSGCSAMKSYSSGTHVKSIGEEAFSDCTGLTSFTTLATVPPTCGNQALDDINKWECTLNVSAESVDDYQVAAQWKEFFFIEGTSGIDEMTVDHKCEITVTAGALIIDGAENMPVSVFSIDGRMIINMPEYRGDEIRLAKGIYIVHVGSRSKKIMI